MKGQYRLQYHYHVVCDQHFPQQLRERRRYAVMKLTVEYHCSVSIVDESPCQQHHWTRRRAAGRRQVSWIMLTAGRRRRVVVQDDRSLFPVVARQLLLLMILGLCDAILTSVNCSRGCDD